jgi:hypothetical protein
VVTSDNCVFANDNCTCTQKNSSYEYEISCNNKASDDTFFKPNELNNYIAFDLSIYFQHKSLKVVEEQRVFENLRIIIFDLSFNKIEYLNEKVFEGVLELRQLVLKSNIIRFLSLSSIYNLTHLD